MATIKAPKVDILLANGEQHTVQITIPDQIQWSRTARARGWDPADEFTATVFTAWNALKRAGLYAESWEQFSTEDAVWAVEHEDEDPEAPSEQDPTVPAS